MAGVNGSLQQNRTLFAPLDPKSLILSSQFSSLESQNKPNLLRPTTESEIFFVMERGPRYKAYAELRESRLRIKNATSQPPPLPPSQKPNLSLTPSLKKQVKFKEASAAATPSRRKGPSSVLAQSVPDFSAALRKENRKPPATMLPPTMEKSATPPAKSSSKPYGGAKLGTGSRSVNSGEKRGLLMARKSYASVEELKGLSLAAANAINGENRGAGGSTTGGGGGRVGSKTVLGYRQCY